VRSFSSYSLGYGLRITTMLKRLDEPWSRLIHKKIFPWNERNIRKCSLVHEDAIVTGRGDRGEVQTLVPRGTSAMINNFPGYL